MDLKRGYAQEGRKVSALSSPQACFRVFDDVARIPFRTIDDGGQVWQPGVQVAPAGHIGHVCSVVDEYM